MRRSSSLHSIDTHIERNISNDKYQDVVTVGQNIDDVVNVATEIVPNIDEILAANDNIDLAVAKAEESTISATESYHWAQYPEDVLVPEGNLIDEYSSYHYALKTAAMESNVAALYDLFDDRFLGPKLIVPIVDNDGDPLEAGMLYFSTADGNLYVYTGTVWSAAIGTSTTNTLTNKTMDSITNTIGANHIHYAVRNESGSLIPQGTVVTYSGTQPGTDYLQVTPMTDSQTQIAVGITHTDLNNNATGLVTNTGVTDDFTDTSAWNEGTILYPNNSGGLTDTKSTSGFYQACAIVTRSHGQQGTLLVEFSEPTVFASTTEVGIVQLVDNLVTSDNTKALTASQGKVLKDTKVETVVGGTGIIVDDTDPLNPVVSSIPSTSTGVLSRSYATADNIILSSGTYYSVLDGDKGTTSNASQSVLVGDDQKLFFAQDFISEAALADYVYYAGSYTGSIDVMTDIADGSQRFTVEVYLSDGDGVVIDSGIATQTVGDLGVKPITIMDTGIMNLIAGNITSVSLSAIIENPFSIALGQRIRFHVSGEKIGTAGGSITLTMYSGSSRSSYVDVPITVNTDTVLNESNVAGATATDAFNSLDSTLSTTTNTLSGYISDLDGRVTTIEGDYLVSTDIGTTIQAYDVDTVKTDVVQTFTVPQKLTETSEDNLLDFTTTQNYTITLGSNLTITASTLPTLAAGESQSGRIIITDTENISGWSGFTWLGTIPTGMTGLGYFGYEIVGTTVYIVKAENV